MATGTLVSFVVQELCSIAKDRLSSLFGVEKEVDELSNTFLDIQAVLEDVESHQVTSERVRGWLWELKEVAYEVKDILDEWVTDAFILQEDKNETHHPKRVRLSFLSPYKSYKQVKLQYDIGKRIRETTKRLSEISIKMSETSIKKNRFNLRQLITSEVLSVRNKEKRETGSFIDESKIFGRDEVKKRLINQLVSKTSREKSVSIVSIVGMGGLGKTTLARLVYNDAEVVAYFEKRIWVCVSDPFDVKRIATEVIESMDRSVSNTASLDTLQRNLGEAVSKTRFLLVLDDVWNENYALWEDLKNPLLGAAQGSKVVVTTRIHQVAVAMETPRINVHELGVLSYSDCWKLFHSRALKGTEEENCQKLTEIGEKIVEKCKGVPLAVKAVGSLLRSRRAKWYWEHVFGSEIWASDDIRKNGILPALLLSYDNLPSHLKQCFSFCSVFPKGHVIEKDELVKLWMANDIIKYVEAKNDDIEEIGGEIYFDDLLTHSLFQDAEKDIYGNIVQCKIHDLVHDLATFVSSGEYCNMEAGSSKLCPIKCHHLSFLNCHVSSIPSLLCKVERLHTLLLFGQSNTMADPDTLFNPLRYLRALDLSGTCIENLPSFIGKLKHLRYLNLRGLMIVELPESVTDLCNLQTLKLSCCKRLRRLPSGISKVVKLRHLEIENTQSLNVLPKGLGSLTSLRTLSKFPVGNENGGCKIGELKDLDLLRGELRIENLQRIKNLNDASEAELHKKSNLHGLSLSCNYKSVEEWTTLGDDEMKRMDSVLEGLRPPHPNLKELEIINYAGSKFPSWLEDSRFSSLVKVVLENCRKCVLLPGLGKLHSLKYLKIIQADEVKVVGSEFYGNADARAKETRFPKLEKLHFESMLNWEEWKLKAMPSLKQQEIFDCKKLKAMPSDGWGLLESLHTLTISCCPKLTSLPEGLGQLKALHTLQIWDCKRLSSLFDGFEQLKSLCRLDIWNCPQMRSLPNMQLLTALERLSIQRCPLLMERLEKEKGEDWCKVSHIPRIHIDGDVLYSRYLLSRLLRKKQRKVDQQLRTRSF